MGSEATSSERRRLLPQGEHEEPDFSPKWDCKPQCRVRRISSKGGMLILLWGVAVFSAKASRPLKDPSVDVILKTGIALVYCPLAGLVGDAYVGRYKFLRANAVMMWLGSMVVVLSSLVQYQLPSTATVLEYCVLLPAYAAVVVGIFGVQVTSITFGIDQFPAASTEELSAFIHWLIWTWFLGMLITDLADGWNKCANFDAGAILVALVTSISATFILSTTFLCKKWLVLEPRCSNPLRNIANVLKFALRHKYPIRRSAFTYWEDKIPSRIDLGKSKYGGPFTNEQVEDVKAFFRITAAIVSILAFAVPSAATFFSLNPYHYKHLDYPCYDSFRLHLVFLAVLCIPVYEFIIYPLLRNWIPSSLKRTAFFGSLTVALSIYMILLEIAGQSSSDNAIPCMFQATENSTVLPISYFAVEIPAGALTAFQWLAFYIAAFEFICAQSPYNMKGLLTGLSVMFLYLAMNLGEAVYHGWSHSMSQSTLGLSCGTWYYLFMIVIGFVGLFLLVVVGMWYKERERDDIVNEHGFAEAYYGRTSEPTSQAGMVYR